MDAEPVDAELVGEQTVGPDSIPTEVLRPALQFAVKVAAIHAGSRPRLPYPAVLTPLLRRARLPAAALVQVRQALVDDPEFRAAVVARSSPDLVDDVGLVWLRRPAGWAATLQVLLAGRGGAPADAGERRRRRAAEAREARQRDERVRVEQRWRAAEARAEHLEHQVAELTAELAAAQRSLATTAAAARRAEHDAGTLRAELAATGHARAAREASWAGRLDQLEAELAAAVAARQEAERIRDIALSGRAEAELPTMAASVPGVIRRAQHVRRQPIALPGGLLGSTAAAAAHLLAHPDTTVLVDGYNVAKLTWPSLALADQREALTTACERVARRWGTDIVVVFDGADVVGASSPGRRVVAVRYSPPGVTADDVIRQMAKDLPVIRHIVVVTDDREIVADARRRGCNVLASAVFAAATG